MIPNHCFLFSRNLNPSFKNRDLESFIKPGEYNYILQAVKEIAWSGDKALHSWVIDVGATLKRACQILWTERFKVWQYLLWSLKSRDTKNRNFFCIKINKPKGIYLIIRIGVVWSCKKCKNLTFKVNFLYQQDRKYSDPQASID